MPGDQPPSHAGCRRARTARAPLEETPFEPGVTHRCVRIGSPFWAYREHLHDAAYEILGIAGGEGIVRIGDTSAAFRAGDIYLLAPRLRHSFYTDAKLDIDPPPFLRAVLVHFPFDASPLARCGDFAAVEGLLDAARRGLRISGAASRRLWRHLDALVEPEGLARLLRFIALLDACANAPWQPVLALPAADEAASEQPTSLQAACRYMELHLREPLDLRAIAGVAGLSRSALCAAFRKHYDCGPMAYLANLRLQRACMLLRDSRRKITDIAFACGFNSLATFNRRFADTTGVSPGHWRRQPEAGGAARRP